MVAYGFSDFNLAPSGETHIVRGMYVSGTYFNVLGINPAFGRLLTPDDDRARVQPDGACRGTKLRLLATSIWRRPQRSRPADRA
jgi:hypothetical protein